MTTLSETLPVSPPGRLAKLRASMDRKQWRQVRWMFASILLAPRHRLRHLPRLRGPRALQGPRHRRLGARVHARPAPRLRRRPHLGHRQHHSEAHERGQEAASASATSSRSATRRSWWPSGRASSSPRRPSTPPSRNNGSGLEQFGGDLRNDRLRVVPLSDRRPEHHHPGRHHQSVPDDAPGRLRRSRARAATREPGPHVPDLRQWMRSITKEWQMYPVGVVFGMGFDTATEVALLATTALLAVRALPWYSIMCLPDPVHRRDDADGHARRVLHELRLRMGLLQSGSEGVLQPHHHRSLGLHLPLHRHDRGARSAPQGVPPQRPRSGTSWPTSTSTRPASSSWACSS